MMTPTPEQIRLALSTVFADDHSLNTAVARVTGHHTSEDGNGATGIAPSAEPFAEADIDLDRERRCGFPEVIFGEGKSSALIVDVLRRQQRRGQAGFVTRVNEEQSDAILAAFPDAVDNRIARTVRVTGGHPLVSEDSGRRGPVFVVTAGSTDRPVAEEAMETLRWMRVECELIQDCGVAGPHRLPKHVPKLRTAVAIVCVAGMEAALPSVLGGHVGCPVIGVPTSVGYGASLHGITAMLSMLTCCASNVVAVNIDAGFKGGYVAGLIASRTPFVELPESTPPTGSHWTENDATSDSRR